MIAPAASKWRTCASLRDSGTRRKAAAITATPIGTLTKKIHSQERYWVRMPPSSSPTAAPPAAIAPQTASAFVRCSPSRKVVVMMDSAAGETNAAPKPWRARAPINIVSEVASPLSRDANAKIAVPATNSRRRPIRSAMRPPSSRKPPNISV